MSNTLVAYDYDQVVISQYPNCVSCIGVPGTRIQSLYCSKLNIPLYQSTFHNIMVSEKYWICMVPTTGEVWITVDNDGEVYMHMGIDRPPEYDHALGEWICDPSGIGVHMYTIFFIPENCERSIFHVVDGEHVDSNALTRTQSTNLNDVKW